MDRACSRQTGISQSPVGSLSRTKPVVNLGRLAELVDVDPFVDGVSLRDVAGAEDDRGDSGGGDA